MAKRRRVNRSLRTFYGFLALSLAGGLLYVSLRTRLSHAPLQVAEVGAPTPPHLIHLSLDPGTLTLKSKSPTTLNLRINAGAARVSAAQIDLTYNDLACGTPILTQGTFLTKSLTSPQVGSGKVSVVYAAPPDSGGISGEGVLATLKVTPTAKCQIQFGDTTAVAEISYSSNALGSVSGSTLTISDTSTPSSPSSPADPAGSDSTSNPTYLPEQDYDYSQTSLDPTLPTTERKDFVTRLLGFFQRLFNR